MLPTQTRADLTFLKWLTILAPLLLVVILHVLLHSLLERFHDPPGVIFVFLVVAMVAAIFSFFIFGKIVRLEKRVLEQNELLTTTNQIASASAANLELEKLLDVTLERVLEVTGATAGIIYVVDPEIESIAASSHSGLTQELATKIQGQKLKAPVTDDQSLSAGNVPAVNLFKDADVVDEARRDGFQSGVAVLLNSKELANAVLGVAVKQAQPGIDLDLLSAIGSHLGLAVRNAILFRRANRRNQELAALLTVGRAAISSLDQPELLDKALEAIIEVTSAETAEVWLRSDKDELVLEQQQGIASAAFHEGTRLKWGEGLPGFAASKGTAVLVHDLEDDPRFLRQQVKELGFKSYCALPLRHRSEVVGVLAVASRDREALGKEAERGLLEGIGERLAIAIENSRLYEQVLDQAVLEERERIARELHDGLAQVLGYINTQTMATKKLVASEQLKEAQSQLNSMEEATRQVYADVREAIMGLGSSGSNHGDFDANLKQYLLDYSDLTGVTVDIELDNGDGAPKLPASTELQLMRIIQEALSNVRKHAQATKASVVFEPPDETLTVRIEDNGRGFAPDRLVRTGWPHFGIRSMSERANAIGGSLKVASAPDEGTKVIVRLPLQRQAQRQ